MSTRKSEHPIIMQGWGVNAILKDLKTQTRRPLKPQPDYGILKAGTQLEARRCPCLGPAHYGRREWGLYGAGSEPGAVPVMAYDCPYGGPGDLLWVRETHYRYGMWLKNGRTKTGRQRWRFKALSEGCWYFDNAPEYVKPNRYRSEGWYKRASIHMPRRASRITLKIKSVRVERVKDITEKDAEAEGVVVWRDSLTRKQLESYGPIQVGAFIHSALECFGCVWDEIHAKKGHGFHANDWVWRIEFERIKE